MILALDLSLSCTGYAVCDKLGNPLEIAHIETSSKLETNDRLKIIGDKLLDIKDRFYIDTVVFENSFYRHIKATQMLYQVRGIAMYIFCDCNLKFYAPTTVKKLIGGTGKASKEDLQNKILELYPDVKFSCNDESDAFALILCYMIENNIIEL